MRFKTFFIVRPLTVLLLINKSDLAPNKRTKERKMRHENFETLFNGFHFIASHEKRIIAVKITPFVPSVSMLALVI